MRHSKYFSLLILLSLIFLVGCTSAVASPATAVPATPAKVEATATAVPATAISVAAATPSPTQPAEDDNPWAVMRQMEVKHMVAVAGFLDEAFGVTVGDGGEIRYTTDGGETWTSAEGIPLSALFNMDFVDENVLWGVGRAGIRVSTDGGRNWPSISDFTYSGTFPYFVSALDAQTGWVASDSKQLWATTDGGKTWGEIAIPQAVQEEAQTKIAAIVLRTASDRYLLDTTGVLYTTQDGGRNWSPQSLGLNEEMFIPAIPGSATMRFFDADHGLIILNVVGGGKSEAWAMRTADGGQTWAQESVPEGRYHLSRDGQILTVVGPQIPTPITVLRNRLSESEGEEISAVESGEQPADAEPQVTIYYGGDAQFELISSDGTRVLIDVAYPDELTGPATEADLLLTTHHHADHYNAAFVEAFPGQQLDAEEGEINLANVNVKAIKSAHLPVANLSGDNYIFVVDMAGLRIAHFGDIGQKELTPEQLDELGEVDIALTQLKNARSQMNLTNKKGFQLMDQVKPKLVIPHHGNASIDAVEYALERWGDGYVSMEGVTVGRSDLSDETSLLVMQNEMIVPAYQNLFDLPEW